MHENLAQAIKEGRQDITLDAILKSQQMKTPADLSEDEMRSGQCEICQENPWPSDAVKNSDPDMIVRIACEKGCIYHRMCIIQALLDNPQCPKCSSWVLCGIHDGKAVLTWSPNSQPPPSASNPPAAAQLDTTAEEDSQESSVPKDNNNSEIEEPERDGLAWDEVGI